MLHAQRASRVLEEGPKGQLIPEVCIPDIPEVLVAALEPFVVLELLPLVEDASRWKVAELLAFGRLVALPIFEMRDNIDGTTAWLMLISFAALALGQHFCHTRKPSQ